MPRPVRRHVAVTAVEERREALDEFTDSTAWQRSKRGNLWRTWEGLTLSIFRRRGVDDLYGWSIADEDGVRYSRESFDSEDDAMTAICDELELIV